MTGDRMGQTLFALLRAATPLLAVGCGSLAAAAEVPDRAAMGTQRAQVQRELAQLWRSSNEAAKVDLDYWLDKQAEACLAAGDAGAPAADLAYEACVLGTLNDQRTRLLRHRDCAQTTVFSCELDDGRQARMCLDQTPVAQASLHVQDGQQWQQWSTRLDGAQASGPWWGFGRAVTGAVVFDDGQRRLSGWASYDRLGGGPVQAAAYSAGIKVTRVDAPVDGTDTSTQSWLCRAEAPSTYLAWPEVVAEQFEQAGLCYAIEQGRWQRQCP